jgi:hypothetical protein
VLPQIRPVEQEGVPIEGRVFARFNRENRPLPTLPATGPVGLLSAQVPDWRRVGVARWLVDTGIQLEALLMVVSFARSVFLALSLLCGLAAELTAADPPDVNSTEAADYDQLALEGWTIHQDQRLSSGGEQADLGEKVRTLLQSQLVEVQQRLPAAAVTHLRRVPIWIELDNSRAGPGCCYHPSRQWLASHGFHPEKAKGVEISNARNFIGWSDDQPAAVLHEFAHAWHDQVLGWDESRIKAQWDAVVASGQYDQVQHVSGKQRKHYALTNHKEYFAEMSEAYYWRNDFHPFLRAELREVDPRMFELVALSWDIDPQSRTSEK